MANKRPPLEMDEITSSLKHSSGRGADAFFPTQPLSETEQNVSSEKSNVSPTTSKPQSKPKANQEISEADDITISRHHDITIETIRKTVKAIGKETTPLRMTPEEKGQLSDIVYAFKKKGVRTSENEINRIASNWLILDYKQNKDKSILARVLEALNA